MKTAVVLSDTHGNVKEILKLLPIIKENDYLIHLGDESKDLAMLRNMNLKTEIISVNGNCDFSSRNLSAELEIEGVKVYCCHGHKFGVKRGVENYLQFAKENNYDLALFGHTHQSYEEVIDGVTLFNPGALYKFTIDKSYGYLVFQKGKVICNVVKI